MPDVILNISDDSTPHEVLFKIVNNERLINDTVVPANLSQKRMVVTLRQTNKQTNKQEIKTLVIVTMAIWATFHTKT